jgi:hypothetical protein
MSDEEAKGVLRSEFLRLRAAGYDALAERLAGKQERLDVVAPSGATYHVEFEGCWDDKEQRDLPFTDAFTVSPSGSITEHSAA